MSRVVRPGCPFALPGVTEAGTVETAVLAFRALQRVAGRRKDLEARSELEDVGRHAERELPAVATQVARPHTHSSELVGLARLRRRHRAARRVDRRRAHEHRSVRLIGERELRASAEVCVHQAGLREIVRRQATHADEPMPHARRPVERRAPTPRHVVRRIDQRHGGGALGEHTAAVQALRRDGSRITGEARPVRRRHGTPNAAQHRRAARQPGRRGCVGEDARPQDVAKLPDTTAKRAGDAAIELADAVHHRAGAVVAVAVVRVREADARTHMHPCRRHARAHTQRLLQCRILRRRAGEAVGLEANAVEKTEKPRRRELMREGRGAVPRGAAARRLRERAREARRSIGGEVGHRVEAERTEPVRVAHLPQTVGAPPDQRFEPVPAPNRIPNSLISPLGGPALVVVRQEGGAAERDAAQVARAVHVRRAHEHRRPGNVAIRRHLRVHPT